MMHLLPVLVTTCHAYKGVHTKYKKRINQFNDLNSKWNLNEDRRTLLGLINVWVLNFQKLQLRIQKIHNYREAVRERQDALYSDSMRSYHEAFREHVSTLG